VLRKSIFFLLKLLGFLIPVLLKNQKSDVHFFMAGGGGGFGNGWRFPELGLSLPVYGAEVGAIAPLM
jgi:hypothetical protein